jgi:predicted TIM-barrel fold metal-dependent hydrolase
MKLGAAEEWAVSDRGQFLDHAIGAFGFNRVMAESNWFVNNAKGESYDMMFVLIRQSCERLGASPEQMNAVFSGNAARTYGLAL